MKISTKRVCATALAVGIAATAAPQALADGFTRITPSQCKAAHQQLDKSGTLPDPSLFRYADGRSSLQGDTLHIHTSTPVDWAVHQAADAWTKASGGKIKFVFHDQPGDGIVDIRIGSSQAGAAGGAGGVGTTRPYINLFPLITQSEPTSAVYIVAHEIGHQLGVGHTCSGDMMKAGTTPGQVAVLPTKADVAAVVQGNPAFA